MANRQTVCIASHHPPNDFEIFRGTGQSRYYQNTRKKINRSYIIQNKSFKNWNSVKSYKTIAWSLVSHKRMHLWTSFWDKVTKTSTAQVKGYSFAWCVCLMDISKFQFALICFSECPSLWWQSPPIMRNKHSC